MEIFCVVLWEDSVQVIVEQNSNDSSETNHKIAATLILNKLAGLSQFFQQQLLSNVKLYFVCTRVSQGLQCLHGIDQTAADGQKAIYSNLLVDRDLHLPRPPRSIKSLLERAGALHKTREIISKHLKQNGPNHILQGKRETSHDRYPQQIT